MAYTKIADSFDGVRGGNIEFGTFTHNAASIAAGTEVAETTTVTGVTTDDIVFVQTRLADAGIYIREARVTADDTITLYIRNETGGTVNVDEITIGLLILKAA